MKILAFAGSNSRQSINKQLVTYAAQLFQQKYAPQAEVQILDLNDYEIPLYSPEIEATQGIPQRAKDFYQKIRESDVIILSLAEYNGSYTPVWKNLFDWMSRYDRAVFQQKPTILLATSPGARGGASVLEQANNSLPRFAAEIKGTLSIPAFYDNFDTEKGKLTNTDLVNQLASVLEQLV